jgi:carbonic anhydrase/acetyltransferase-like protein (isoleucine patch superfamily)
MGSIVLDGAVIGEDSFVAAGSLVTPKTVVPPRSFVIGRPAKVTRRVTQEDLDWIHDAAKLYAGYARDFRNGCSRID